MSCAVDANVLLFASNVEDERCDAARALLERLAAGPELLYLPWPVLLAYLRIASHPRVFAAPLAPAQALANVEHLIACPNARVLGEGDRFWSSLRLALGDPPVGGRAVSDAHVAALLLEHGVRVLYTGDADFRRYDFLEVRDPFR